MFELDSLVTRAINGTAGQHPCLDQAMIWVSALGVPVMIALVALQWWRREDRPFVRHVLVAAGLSFLLGEGLNQLILLVLHRPRPYVDGVTHLLIPPSTDWSLPSDHATAAMAVAAAFLLHRMPRAGAVLLAAALLMTTHRKADELGIPADQRVYLRGWSFGRDATHLAGRASLSRSRAMELASRDALQQAGIGIDDVAHLDLYSCFASSVLFATNALGLDPDDARGLTVTGGLPYHGGPASNYTTHAIAEMVTRLRGNSQTYGLVNGVGMHMTKHVWAVYGSEPGPVAPPDYDEVQRQIDLEPGSEVLQELTAPLHATIAAATTTFGRDGSPSSALVIADVTDDVRAYARTTDPELVASVLEGAAVGQAVTLRPAGSGAHDVTLRT